MLLLTLLLFQNWARSSMSKFTMDPDRKEMRDNPRSETQGGSTESACFDRHKARHIGCTVGQHDYYSAADIGVCRPMQQSNCYQQ